VLKTSVLSEPANWSWLKLQSQDNHRQRATSSAESRVAVAFFAARISTTSE